MRCAGMRVGAGWGRRVFVVREVVGAGAGEGGCGGGGCVMTGPLEVEVEHPRLGVRAQFDCNLVQFDVGGEETEAPEVPRLQ